MKPFPFSEYNHLQQLPDDDYWHQWAVEDESRRILIVRKLKHFDGLSSDDNQKLCQQGTGQLMGYKMLKPL